jgi:hypothetical protein
MAASDRFEWQLVVHGPLVTRSWSAPQGDVALRQELGSLLMSMAPWRGGGLALETTALVGAYHLSVQGEVEPPLQGRSDEVWSLAIAPGFALLVELSSTTALRVGASAAFLLPRPTVRLGDTDERLGQPMLLGSAGLRVGL